MHMLKLEHLFENFDLAREALTNYHHDPERLDETLGWFRISSNAVYPFFQGENLCFLRLCPAEEKPEGRVEEEIEFIEYLIAHDFPAMEPVPAVSGKKCRTISTKWGSYRMSAFKSVPGASLEDTEMTPDIVREYGAALGRLHNLSEGFAPIAKRPSLEETAREIRENLPGNLVPALQKVMDELSEIPRTAENFGLVHYDFEPDNVFFHPETGRISVIDFDDSMYHFYAADVAQALDSIPEDVRPTFLEGYRSARKFTDEMEKTNPLMLRFIALRSASRLNHCLSSNPPSRPEWLENLEGMLKNKFSFLTENLLNP